ncbi:MAG: tryptophan--tRNA ligase [Oscillospiraceae bacterium]|nr:tryptophan--tRNA ligase [Oscillospiraceae bacterium]
MTLPPSNKTILSAVQPTGQLHVGNYLGAIKNWLNLQEDNNCIFFVVDLHALTTRHVPAELRKSVQSALAVYLACGLDPDKSTLFVQSHLSAHAELSWLLSCYTMFGELSRMTQFKDKSSRNADNINTGLFSYPVLMAADILLFQTDFVPVGDDQKQHLELARDVATRFNGIYGDTFTVPAGYHTKEGARIMSLADPTRKMSKSEPSGCTFLLDSRDDIIKKFKRAVTDSGSDIIASPDKPGVTNLLNVYSSVTGKPIATAQAEFAGLGYGDFKLAVGEVVADMLAPISGEYNRIIADKAYLESVAKSGAEKAFPVARKTLSKVYKRVGLR